MAAKKSTTRKTTTLRSNAKPVKRRRRSPINSRRVQKPSKFFNFLVPVVFIVVILSVLGFLAFKGYQTVTASSFFDIKKIEVRGISRVSKEDVERIVRMQAENNGVWNARLEQIKADLEKLNFVKTAVVSRLLPDGILVKIDERSPKVVARLGNGDYWVDDDGVIVAAVGKNENRPPFVLRGWDESKAEKAQKENQERVKFYTKTLEEWKSLGIEKRVTALNLSDLQDVSVMVEDSNQPITIFLGKEDIGKRLQRALTVIEGKGQEIESLISHGGNVVAKYRNS